MSSEDTCPFALDELSLFPQHTVTYGQVPARRKPAQHPGDSNDPPLPLPSGPSKGQHAVAVHCKWEVVLCTKRQRELLSSDLRYTAVIWITGKDCMPLLRLIV